MPRKDYAYGSVSRKTLERLHRYESPNVTFIAPDGSWPIVWERAHGLHVWDAEGRKYLDLTAAFGVAAAGHANRRVVKAAQQQLERLPHAMGDVHPHPLKAELAQTLSRLTFERWKNKCSHPLKKIRSWWGKTIFCNSGFEAVEAALKTAHLATGRRGIIAFEGGYHGLGYGALNATHRPFFRQPFLSQLAQFGQFVPFPIGNEHDVLGSPPVVLSVMPISTARGREGAKQSPLGQVEALLESGEVGAVLVEPIQARGGIRLPPWHFLPDLRQLCDRYEALLIVDEIYTGFGRTGAWFACEHNWVVPDLICLGKALTGGFPLSACVGHAGLMNRAWPPSRGEAIHTSTFLGNPVGCAMALAHLREIEEKNLVQHSARVGAAFLAELKTLEPRCGALEVKARGLGLMLGLELRREGQPAGAEAMQVVKQMLHRGFIVLPEGEHGEVISFTPPLIIKEEHARKTVRALREILEKLPVAAGKGRPAA
ncbi:MAG: aspartate aminotransferase family protein [Verrucomicrobiae bacterium]|nr:aspartate aminotransferase family protein [Verrucomicrobiae bacterium]